MSALRKSAVDRHGRQETTSSPQTIAQVASHTVTQDAGVNAQARDDIASASISKFGLLTQG